MGFFSLAGRKVPPAGFKARPFLFPFPFPFPFPSFLVLPLPSVLAVWVVCNFTFQNQGAVYNIQDEYITVLVNRCTTVQVAMHNFMVP